MNKHQWQQLRHIILHHIKWTFTWVNLPRSAWSWTLTTSNGLTITASVMPAKKPASVNVYITNTHAWTQELNDVHWHNIQHRHVTVKCGSRRLCMHLVSSTNLCHNVSHQSLMTLAAKLLSRNCRCFLFLRNVLCIKKHHIYDIRQLSRYKRIVEIKTVFKKCRITTGTIMCWGACLYKTEY